MNQLPASNGSEGINLLDILSLFKKYGLTAIVVGAFVAAGVFAYLRFFVSPYYESSSHIIATPRESTPSPGGLTGMIAQAAGIGGGMEELNQYRLIFRTAELQERVRQRLDLKSVAKPVVGTELTSLKIITQSQSPELAARINQAYLDVLDEFLQEMYSKRAESNKAFFAQRVQEAEKSIKALERDMGRLSVNEAQREMSVQQKILSLIREQYEMAQIEAKKNRNTFTVIDPPNIPTGPKGPMVMRSTAIGFIVGSVMTMLLLILVNFVRRDLHAQRAAPALIPGGPRVPETPKSMRVS